MKAEARWAPGTRLTADVGPQRWRSWYRSSGHDAGWPDGQTADGYQESEQTNALQAHWEAILCLPITEQVYCNLLWSF